MRSAVHLGSLRGLVLVVVGWLILLPCGAAAAKQSAKPAVNPSSVVRLRYPIALALGEQGTVLLAANQRSGTISLVDLKAGRVLAEVPIGKRLSDLVVVSGPPQDDFLATDWSANQLTLLSLRGGVLKIADSIPVSPFPASVCCDKSGRQCFVASQWSRRLTLVELRADANNSFRLKPQTTIPLRFAPRLMLLSPDGKILIVADAFGGNLAVVDVAKRRIQTQKTIPGHNIRGLAWSPDGRRLLVSQQTLNPLAYTTTDDIHWGSVVSNGLRSLLLDSLVDPGKDVLAQSQFLQLGDVGNGAGDPAGIAATKDGTVFVALAGVGEVAGGRLENGEFRRLPAGIRPTALAASADGKELYVADTFGDTITIQKSSAFQPAAGKSDRRQVSLGPQPPLSSVDRGERLFFDARLSHEKWMSCHSCHTDGQSSDQLSDTLGDGSFGAPKRIPPLGGVAQTGPWAWNGSVHTLAEQVQKSALTTMRARSITPERVRDLTDYLATIEPPPAAALSDAAGPSNAAGRGVVERGVVERGVVERGVVERGVVERGAAERGRAVFKRHGCDRCHVPGTYTSPKTYDVELADEMGNHRFNPPSLRGVGQRAFLLHDGRADSLESVFGTHRHPGKTDLPTDERADLLAFLRSL